MHPNQGRSRLQWSTARTQVWQQYQGRQRRALCSLGAAVTVLKRFARPSDHSANSESSRDVHARNVRLHRAIVSAVW